MKRTLSCLLITLLFSLSAYCNKWEDDLIAGQKPVLKGSRFPVITYHAWVNHDIGGELEERTTADISRAVFLVVAGAFVPTSNYHVEQFVDRYNDGKFHLSNNNIPTYIIVGDKPPVVAAWAKKLGVRHDLLRFIPDPTFTLMSRLGVLDKGATGGLVGKTSLFYVENGEIVKLKTEEKYGEVTKTSPKNVEKFVNKHWSSGLPSPRKVDQSVESHAVDPFDKLVQEQKLLVKGDTFPAIHYKVWMKKYNLETKTTRDSRRAVFVVVPGAFLPTSTYHVGRFMEAYADPEHTLRKRKIPTFVVSCDNPSAIEAWAKEMKTPDGLLCFIPDQSYTLTSQLGVLETDRNYGLLGRTSIFFVEDDKIIEQKFEESFGAVIETSPQKVTEFVQMHWLSSPLPRPRQEAPDPVLAPQVEATTACEFLVKSPPPPLPAAPHVEKIAPERKRIVHVGFSHGNADSMNTSKADGQFASLKRIQAILLEKYKLEISQFRCLSPYKQGEPRHDLVLYQLIPEEAEGMGILTWQSFKQYVTRDAGPHWAYMISLKPGQKTPLIETLMKPENMNTLAPIFINFQRSGSWGALEITDAEAEKTAATIAGYFDRLK